MPTLQKMHPQRHRKMKPEVRLRVMRAIRKTNTLPELLVRRRLHAMGYRFRLHCRDLPGTPDIVLPRHRLAIQVYGCFWHQHAGCGYCRTPRTRPDYWPAKLARNVERDARSDAALRAAGWRTAVIWECEARNDDVLRRRLGSLF
jgi:DNA mismatch endonuclease (patch repair protein)